MTGIEQKALALLKTVRSNDALSEALRLSVAKHEAFRQEVSNAVSQYADEFVPADLKRFIIAKPDPLHECLEKALARTGEDLTEHTERLRAALDARGLEIREKTND